MDEIKEWTNLIHQSIVVLIVVVARVLVYGYVVNIR